MVPIDTAVVVMASWGDVVISTLVVRAIKEQRKDVHVTFYTSSACKGAVFNNPKIDKLEVIPANKAQAWGLQDKIINKARQKHQLVITPWAGFTPQHEWVPIDMPGTPHNFMWAYVRVAQLHGLVVPIPPTLYLYPTETEQERAKKFVESLVQRKRTVMMEIQAESAQSFWNPKWTRRIIPEIIKTYGGDVTILISRGGGEPPEVTELKKKFKGQIYLLNEYSLREVSVIFNSCDVFVGLSSGTSNACHTHLCKKDIQWFEAINDRKWCSAPLRKEGKHFFFRNDPEGFAKLLRENLA